MGSVARCGVEGGRYVLLAASRLTDRAYAAGDSPAGATPLDDSPCPPGHNTPLPLERLPPVSFKRLLGGCRHEREREECGDQDIRNKRGDEKVPHDKDRVADVGKEKECHDRPNHQRGGLRDRGKLPKEHGFEQTEKGRFKTVAEVEVPIATHGTNEIEVMRLHGLDHGALFRPMLRGAEEEQKGVGGELNERYT